MTSKRRPGGGGFWRCHPAKFKHLFGEHGRSHLLRNGEKEDLIGVLEQTQFSGLNPEEPLLHLRILHYKSR